MSSKPFLGPDDVLRLKETIVSLQEKTPAQETAQPEQKHKSHEATHCCGKIDPKKIESPDADKESAASSDGVPGKGRKYIFQEGTDPQQEIDVKIGKRIEKIQKVIEVEHQGYLLCDVALCFLNDEKTRPYFPLTA